MSKNWAENWEKEQDTRYKRTLEAQLVENSKIIEEAKANGKNLIELYRERYDIYYTLSIEDALDAEQKRDFKKIERIITKHNHEIEKELQSDIEHYNGEDIEDEEERMSYFAYLDDNIDEKLRQCQKIAQDFEYVSQDHELSIEQKRDYEGILQEIDRIVTLKKYKRFKDREEDPSYAEYKDDEQNRDRYDEEI